MPGSGQTPWDQTGMPPEYFSSNPAYRLGPQGSYGFRDSRGQVFQVPGAGQQTSGLPYQRGAAYGSPGRPDYQALVNRPGAATYPGGESLPPGAPTGAAAPSPQPQGGAPLPPMAGGAAYEALANRPEAAAVLSSYDDQRRSLADLLGRRR